MRKFLVGVCLLLVSSASWAQKPSASWDNLNKLLPGEKIQVVAANPGKVTGEFVSVSDAALSVRIKGAPAMMQRQDVRSVRLMKNRHRLRNALIGGGIGAGAGAGISAAAWEKGGFLGGKGAGAAVGAVIGGASGLIVGVFLPSHETIYDVSSRRKGQ